MTNKQKLKDTLDEIGIKYCEEMDYISIEATDGSGDCIEISFKEDGTVNRII